MVNLAFRESPTGHVDAGDVAPAECAEPSSHEPRGRDWCRFRAERNRVAGMDGVRLTDGLSGERAFVAFRGATLVEWMVPFGAGHLSLTDGYRNAAELLGQDGVRNGVMAPFPNRIANARYHHGHRNHDLLPGCDAGERLIYHGFVRKLVFDLVEAREDGDGAEVLLRTEAIRADAFHGYPFSLVVHVRVRLGMDGLALTITATNVGYHSAPYAAGWHPYFGFGGESVDCLELQVPAQQTILADDNLLPLPGASAHASIETRPELDFRLPRPIGPGAIDAALSGLSADADGIIRTRLRDPKRGCGLTVWQEGGLVHLFTGDTLARSPRRSVAIEPVETMTDAFNRDDCRAAIELAPGASRSFRCGAKFTARLDWDRPERTLQVGAPSDAFSSARS